MLNFLSKYLKIILKFQIEVFSNDIDYFQIIKIPIGPITLSIFLIASSTIAICKLKGNLTLSSWLMEQNK